MVISYLFISHIPRIFSHQSTWISVLILPQLSSFLHSMLKLIMVMSLLSEKKINFHCHTDLTNNRVQVRRKWEIITQRTLSLLFVPTAEQKWRGSRGGIWGWCLEVCMTFNKILEKELKNAMGHWLLANSRKKGGRKKNTATNLFLKNKKAYSFMHVIKATELKSPAKRHRIWKMGLWQPKFAKAVTY